MRRGQQRRQRRAREKKERARGKKERAREKKGEGEGKKGEEAKLTPAQKAAAKKEEIRKAHEEDAKRAAKKADPRERMKVFLSGAGKIAIELKGMQSETSQRSLTAGIPPRILAEYKSTVGSHIKVISESRDVFETKGSAVKCVKKLAQRFGPRLDDGESEMQTARCTLRSWKNVIHVYGKRSSPGSSEKGGSASKSAANSVKAAAAAKGKKTGTESQ